MAIAAEARAWVHELRWPVAVILSITGTSDAPQPNLVAMQQRELSITLSAVPAPHSLPGRVLDLTEKLPAER